MAELTLRQAKKSIKYICDDRLKALIKTLYLLDEYADGSLSPEEYKSYERTKKILIKRHSQHRKP